MPQGTVQEPKTPRAAERKALSVDRSRSRVRSPLVLPSEVDTCDEDCLCIEGTVRAEEDFCIRPGVLPGWGITGDVGQIIRDGGWWFLRGTPVGGVSIAQFDTPCHSFPPESVNDPDFTIFRARVTRNIQGIGAVEVGLFDSATFRSASFRSVASGNWLSVLDGSFGTIQEDTGVLPGVGCENADLLEIRVGGLVGAYAARFFINEDLKITIPLSGANLADLQAALYRPHFAVVEQSDARQLEVDWDCVRSARSCLEPSEI